MMFKRPSPGKAARRPQCWSEALAVAVLLAGIPTRGQALLFRVSDDAMGQPIAREPLRLLIAGDQAVRRLECRTDEMGRLRLEDPDGELLWSTIIFGAEGKAPVEWKLETTPVFSRVFSVAFHPGRSGGGRVIDRWGHPVNGALISLRTRTAILVPLAVSAANGTWSSRDLPEDASARDIQIRGPRGSLVVESHGDPLASNLLSVLATPRPILVHITAPSGEPIEGVRLTVGDDTFWTAGDGVAEVLLAHAPGLTLSGERSGYAAFALQLNDDHAVSVTMARSRSITLEFRDPHGTGIAGVLVRDVEGANGRVHWRGHSDVNGAVTLDCAPEGEISVQVLHPDFISQRISIPSGARKAALHVALRRPFLLRGEAHSAPDGAPAPFQGVEAARLLDGEATAVPVAYLAQDAGSYTVGVTNTEAPDLFRFQAGGCAPLVIRIPPAAAKAGRYWTNLIFHPQQWIRGNVVDALGAPVPQAAIVLCAPSQPVVLGNQSLVTAGLPHVGSTDESGRFKMAKCPVHHLLLVADRRGFARLDTASVSNRVRIQLSPWGSIHVTLHRGPFCPSNLSVSLLPSAGSGLALAADVFSKELHNASSFDFRHVPPGRFGLWCGSAETGFLLSATAQVDRAAHEVELGLSLGTNRVTGALETNNLPRLFDRTNVVFPVFLTPLGHPTRRWEASLRPPARFAFIDVPPGGYSLEVQAHDAETNPDGSIHCWGAAETRIQVVPSRDLSLGGLRLRLEERAEAGR